MHSQLHHTVKQFIEQQQWKHFFQIVTRKGLKMEAET